MESEPNRPAKITILAISTWVLLATHAFAVTSNAVIQATVGAVFSVSVVAQPGTLTGDDDLGDISLNTNDVNQFKFAIRSMSPTPNLLVNTSGSGAGYEYPFFVYLPEQVAGNLHASIAADTGSNPFPSSATNAVALTSSFANNRWILTHNVGQAAANTVFDFKVKQSTVAPSSLFSGTYENNVEVQLVDI